MSTCTFKFIVLSIGTVLTVENPYVFTLDRHLKWNLGHCHHCLKRVRRGIPCTSCVFVSSILPSDNNLVKGKRLVCDTDFSDRPGDILR